MPVYQETRNNIHKAKITGDTEKENHAKDTTGMQLSNPNSTEKIT